MLTNFSLSLALFAGLASAEAGYTHATSHQPGYAARYVQPHHVPRPSYNQHNYHHHGPSHQHAYANAWGQQALQAEDTQDWWSPYQQYRPAVIAYKPAPLHEPVFAICEEIDAINSSGISGEIRFAQVKGHPVQVRSEMFGLSTSTDYWFRINKTGRVGTNCDATLADEEFNPMYAIDKYGNSFTHQDPWRGRIDPISNDGMSADPVQQFDQNHLYQNLSGKDSIIGRSITMFDNTNTKDDLTDDNAVGCCVISRDEKPEARRETNVHHHSYPLPHPKPQHHHHVNQYQAPPEPKPQPVSHYHQPKPEPKPVTHYHQPEPVSHYHQAKPQPVNHYQVSHHTLYEQQARPQYEQLFASSPQQQQPSYNSHHHLYSAPPRNGYLHQYQQYPYAW